MQLPELNHQKYADGAGNRGESGRHLALQSEMFRKYLKIALWVFAIIWVAVVLLVHMRLTLYSQSPSAPDEHASSCRAVAAIAAALPREYRNVEVPNAAASSGPVPLQPHSKRRERQLPVLPRVAVYRPFVTKDIPLLLMNMKAWSNAALAPCHSSPLLPTASSVDLVFWAATPSTEFEALTQLVEHAPWRKCFGEVKFRSFSKKENLKETGYDAPSIVFQFLSVFRDLRSQGYSYVFQMEPDVLPIRSGWVDRLLHICTAASAGINDFWMMASVTVKDEFDTSGGQVQSPPRTPNLNPKPLNLNPKPLTVSRPGGDRGLSPQRQRHMERRQHALLCASRRVDRRRFPLRLHFHVFQRLRQGDTREPPERRGGCRRQRSATVG